MKKILQLLILTLILFSISKTRAQQRAPFDLKKFCDRKIELVPTIHNNREQPLFTRASNVIKKLTGHAFFEGFHPQVTYCEHSLDKKAVELKTYIKNTKIRSLLNIKEQDRITYDRLITFKTLLEKKLQVSAKEKLFYEDLKDILENINLYTNLIEGNEWLYPQLIAGKIRYTPISKLKNLDWNIHFTHEKLLEVIITHNKNHNNRINIELKYLQIHPESYALIATLLAFIAVILFSRFEIALIFSFVTMLIQFFSIISRMYISRFSTLLNVYDIVIYLALGILFSLMALGHLKNNKKFVLTGLGINFIIIFISLFINRMI